MGVSAGITIHTADKPVFFSQQKMIEGVLVPPPREDWVDLDEATIIDYMVKPRRATGTKGTHSHPVEMHLVTVDELRDFLTVSTSWYQPRAQNPNEATTRDYEVHGQAKKSSATGTRSTNCYFS